LSNALLAIARNAIALLDDAEFLFQNGRYPRATALAVLAGEEAGKFWLMKWKPTG
jgi:AbiV family abortive infection protein